MKRSFIRDIVLSWQHFFAMYAGAIAVPLIVGKALNLNAQEITYLISADLLTSGIATILHIIKGKYFGVGLPVILGASFNSVGAYITIGSTMGLPFVYGSIIVSGLVILLFAPFISKIVRYFPPVIIGVVISIIGISLMPLAFSKMGGDVGSPSYGSATNLLLAFSTLIFIFLWHQLTRGFLKTVGILISIILFSFIAHFFLPIQISLVHETGFFSFPTFFYFGSPQFALVPIFTMLIILFITCIESLGDLFTLAAICEKPLTSADITRGYRSEGLGTIFGGLFNAFTYSNFAQNIGLVQITGVKRVSVIGILSAILIILSFFPKIAALSTLIPSCVLGAIMLIMFGIIATGGLRLLSQVDFSKDINIWTIALGLGVGVGTIAVPNLFHNIWNTLKPLTSNAIINSSVTSIIVYFTIKGIENKKKGTSL
jgi:xanthine permease